MPKPFLHLPIAAKFLVLLAILGPLMLLLAWVGIAGLQSMRDESNIVFADNIRVSEVTTEVGNQFDRTEEISLELVATRDRRRSRELYATLDGGVIPRIEAGLADLQRLHADDPLAERAPVEQLASGWRRFLSLRQRGVLEPTAAAPASRRAREIGTLFTPLLATAGRLDRVEREHAGLSHAEATRTYDRSLRLILAIAAASLVLGVGSVMVLIRNVVPRLRQYSGFATAVAAGDLSGRLRPTGSDELAHLGTALDHMLERRVASLGQEDRQAEFVETLQLTQSEEEAYDLLKRQLERSIPDSAVVVLRRNNSADRLEATTEIPEGSPLLAPLVGAKPRSCLAVRFSRSHQEAPGNDALIHCELCGKTAKRATCEPLLVGGEVMGSVIVEHPLALEEHETQAIRAGVSGSAPVLANLRNLAIAERRAATDALTGMPNNRAVQDTLKHMVAEALRLDSPLSAVLVDLDHFKQINDTFGHQRGDDVLAAVGSMLNAVVRESDFAGRYGGEEFLLLLPATDVEGAAIVAEKARAAVAGIAVAGVERSITASFGVAGIPDHASDADGLIRSADRALYMSKTNGRDRVEVAAGPSGPAPDGPPVLSVA